MHRRLGNSAVPGNLLGLARLYERIINDEPPLAIQGARIGSHSVFHFFHRQMCCCTRDSCHTFPLLFSVITSFILSQYADWYEPLVEYLANLVMGECKINVLPIIQPRKLAVERSENLCLDCVIDMLCHNLFSEMACP